MVIKILLLLICALPVLPNEAIQGMISQPDSHPNNTLTAQEKAEGWKLLFDGKQIKGWHSYGKKVAGKSWIVDDDAIVLDAHKDANGKWSAPDGGDLTTDDEYENFELDLEWKISDCGNSGIIYDAVEAPQYGHPWETGPEMQVLDNSCHPDAKYPKHRAGDLYDLIAATPETVKPAGEWNAVRLIKHDGHVEHWLNGVKVVEYQMSTDSWREMIAHSKFKNYPDFGKASKGRICLQDHDNDRVWYRNIKIKKL